MTTLALRRLRRLDGSDLALMTGVSVWAVGLFALRIGLVHPAVDRLYLDILGYGTPIVLCFAAFLRRGEPGVLPLAAGFSACVILALALDVAASRQPKIAYAIPAGVLAGVITVRRPAASLITLFALTGFYGSIMAFTPLPADSMTSWITEALWVGVLGRLVLNRELPAVRVTPALVLIAAVMVLSIGSALTTSPVGNGVTALKLAPQVLSLVLLIGCSGFRARDLDLFARAIVVICLLVDAYAALRWAIGPAAKEAQLSGIGQARQYNTIAHTNETKLQGSFRNGNSLGLWLACTTPFVVAAVLSWRGTMRIVALMTLPVAAIALFGSGQRTATAAVFAGILAVVVVHVVSRGYRGPRLGVAGATIVALIVSAAVVYPAVVDSPEKRQRYSDLLRPSRDPSFQERREKWRQTIHDLRGHPFGYGLGSGNSLADRRFKTIAARDIDNSYLMVAWEQGLAVGVLFVVAMVALLLELLRHAVWTRGPGGAASTAAVGVLVAIMVEFATANYIVYPVMIAGWLAVGLGVAALNRVPLHTRSRTSSSPDTRLGPAPALR
ncbi:MAG: hypothetical protein QOI80_965 [Solirubrobacteraceae bacterium]|jgi:hypothetical protein|nr:hypothetical protein [Solirubrobacteraceae bacterium]